MSPAKKRTAALIRWELGRAEEEIRLWRQSPGTGPDRDAAWRALVPNVERLLDELTEAEIVEEERRQRPVRWTALWAAVAAVVSAVAAGGTWWQATHTPPARIEIVQPAPTEAPRGPGPWRPNLER